MNAWKCVLIIYDIEDNKRRNKVVKVLESYGVRVQKSAFECYANERRLGDLKDRLKKYIEDDDSIRIYTPFSRCYDVARQDSVELFKQGTVII